MQFLDYLRFAHADWFEALAVKVPHYFNTFSPAYKGSRWRRGISELEFLGLLKTLYLNQGGIETLRSYGVSLQGMKLSRVPKNHLEYLCNMPLYYETSKFIVTDALPVLLDLNAVKAQCKKNRPSYAQLRGKLSGLLWNRSLDKVSRIGKKKLSSGHSPFAKVKRTPAKNVIQIDTLCFRGGALTAYCPEDDKEFRVRAKNRYFKSSSELVDIKDLAKIFNIIIYAVTNELGVISHGHYF